MTNKEDNYYKIGDDLWLVRTQAGFKKLQKEISWEGYNDGYPKSYPSIVTSYNKYVGYHKTMFVCTPVNEYIIQQKEMLSKIRIIDRIHNNFFVTRVFK